PIWRCCKPRATPTRPTSWPDMRWTGRPGSGSEGFAHRGMGVGRRAGGQVDVQRGAVVPPSVGVDGVARQDAGHAIPETLVERLWPPRPAPGADPHAAAL